ncbi:hypothetical protein LEP1GSC040_1262 [Leptospira santarosai str. 2000030832]|nr:hypothetical protein LEP1GSC040_1262 [Leptospira santarosai str. 2000030832]
MNFQREDVIFKVYIDIILNYRLYSIKSKIGPSLFWAVGIRFQIIFRMDIVCFLKRFQF